MPDFLDRPGGDPSAAGISIKERIRRDYPELEGALAAVNVSTASGQKRRLQFYSAADPGNPTPGSHHFALNPAMAASGAAHHAIARRLKTVSIGQAPIDRERASQQDTSVMTEGDGEGAAKVRAPRRTRSRSSTFKIDKTVIAERVIKFFTDDNTDRQFDIEARIQRYAKFRMWTEGKTDPWPGASDVGLSDIATAVLKMEDTLHNAAMQTRPVTNAKAFKESDRDKQQIVDNLLDYQFFVEGAGEVKVGRMAHNYVMDGVMRVFVPWVKEERAVHDVRQFPEIPEGEQPGTYLAKQIMTVYPAPMFRASELDPD
ncbi:MAG: hypothetical protein NUW01_01420, partial [Gemmatimonadaceae bacterium]|nr:hypothetical protein [Gemmatimonadaceae bacterium]